MERTTTAQDGATPPLLTRTDVAALLNCSNRLVRKLTDTRQLGTVKVGALVRYEEGEVQRYIESCRRPSAQR
jgi:excisionase family DNA binding protein